MLRNIGKMIFFLEEINFFVNLSAINFFVVGLSNLKAVTSFNFECENVLIAV